MGRPRVKIIDDAAPVEEPKKVQAKPARNASHNDAGGPAKREKDSLIAQLNAELGVEEPKAVSSQSSDTPVIPAEAGIQENQDSGSPIKSGMTKRKNDTKSKQDIAAEKVRSKKYLEASKDLDRTLDYSILEAIEQVKKNSITKFPGSLEAHINTRFPNIRGMVSLPFVSGKKRTILAFGKEAENSGADLVGTDETLEEIGKGKINFEILVVTPEWMPKLAKFAKVLGPKGLMPNPKNGTVTTDLGKTVASFQEGQTEYKTEAKAPVMHISLGKLDQPNEELESNIKLLLTTIGKSRIKKVTLAPTMGPSVKLNLSTL